MPFRFVYVCDLLEKLSEIFSHDPPFLSKEVDRLSSEAIVIWFKRHKKRIEEADGVALLSTLVPERRTDRVYELKERSLEKVIARIFALPISRRIDLERWRQPGAGDLGDCIERVQRLADTPVQARSNEVTVEEIDQVLSAIASQSRFSSPSVKALKECAKINVIELLSKVYLRLQARESMWLTRLILKSYLPIKIPEWTVYKSYHYLLPSLLKVQSDFPAAIKQLQDLLVSNGGELSIHLDWTDVVRNLRPVIGTKIGRQPFFKARSIKHCAQMIQNRRMCVEKKYDGEYCQIHIDMSQPRAQQIKIFSKSGKDSTLDRCKIHSAIRESLRLDASDSKIRKQCILEGELVVFCERQHKILDFHAIRKHVTRSGVSLGTDLDSPAHDHEHLMIVYFDILLHDDEPVLNSKHHERIEKLENLVTCIPGRAIHAERQVINFSQRHAPEMLRKIFAQSITSNGEGLVVKPADEPYFSHDEGASFRSCCIKMKKEYIGNSGDVGDFAVVGASYDAVKAKGIALPGLQWTDCYIGCLENKEDVRRWDVKPRFKVVAIISPGREVLQQLKTHCASTPNSTQQNCVKFDLVIERGLANGQMPDVVFPTPFVFDIRCFSFHKDSNTSFWTMRFPSVTKIHFDRTFLDTMSFAELQELARENRTSSHRGSQEDLRWIKQLESADPRGIPVDASTQQSTQSSCPISSPMGPPPRFIRSSEKSIERDASTQRSDTVSSLMSPLRNHSNSFEGVAQSNAATQRFPGFSSSMGPPPTPPRPLQAKTAERGNPDALNKTNPSRPFQPQRSPVLKRKVLSDSPLLEKHPQKRRHGSQSSSDQSISTSQLSDPLSEIHNEATPPRTQPTSSGSVNVRPQNPYPQAAYPTPCSTDGPGVTSKTTDQIGSRLTGPGVHPSASTEEHRCRLRPNDCILRHYYIFLSPCIATSPWLIEDLLPAHRVRFTANLSEWQTLKPSKSRKIILVERNREDATKEILRTIENLDIRRSDGERQRFAVYDWRLLEDITHFEKVDRADQAVWRRYWVGCV